MKLLHEEYREKLNFILLDNLKILAKLASHLWEIENINSFVDYFNNVENNETALAKSSEILYLLAMNKNPYFNLYLDNDPSTEDENAGAHKVADIERVKRLIAKNIFHENKQIALNFCLLSESIMLFNHKQFASENSKASQNMTFLFDLTKSGLFSIILKCDKSIKLNKSQENKINPEEEMILKVSFFKNNLFNI